MTSRSADGTSSRLWWLGTAVVALLVLIAGCSTSGGGETPAESIDIGEGASEEPSAEPSAAAEGPQVVDGKLIPLEDGFPNSPITLWNTFEPGHQDDLFNIAVAEIASEYSPVRVTTQSNPVGPNIQYDLAQYVEGQPGGEEGYHAYAIGWFGTTLRPFTLESLADHSLEDLNPINIMETAPFVFVVPPDSEFESLADVEAYGEANPGELRTVGSATGSGLHSSLLAWSIPAGVEHTFVPTDGSGQSQQLLLGGGAELGVLVYTPGIEDQLKVIAVTGSEPASALPGVPTTDELGYSIPSGSYRGYGTVPGIPQEHMDWLVQLFELVAEDPRFAESQVGFDVIYLMPEEVQDVREEVVDVFLPILEDLDLVVNPPS